MGATRFAPAAAAALFLLLALLSAWHCDDAWISFRTAENVVSGAGLTWNPGERVQAFTHPLWLAFVIACRTLTGGFFYSVLLGSLALVTLAVGGLAWRGRHAPILVGVLLLALSTSKASVDYATSGLGTPLLYALLVGFALAAERALEPPRRPQMLLLASLLGCGVVLTRLDALLLVAPALLLLAWRCRKQRGRLAMLALGFAPLVLWEVFSLLWFGVPLPNTAYAKLNLDLSRFELVGQGFHYLKDSLRRDPVTLLLLGIGATIALRRKELPAALAVGGLLGLLYVLRVGGDFMTGRFLVAPLAVTVAGLVLSLEPLEDAARLKRSALVVVGAVVIYGLLWPSSPWRSNAAYGLDWTPDRIIGPHLITDERAVYYQGGGLLPALLAPDAAGPPPHHKLVHAGRAITEPVTAAWSVGFAGFFAPPGTHLVDRWALTDPLLARIPFQPDGRWRIGHYPRPVPEGYLETLRGTGAIADPALAAAWDDIVLATRAPLFADGRLGAIWRLNTGHHAAAFAAAARPVGMIPE